MHNSLYSAHQHLKEELFLIGCFLAFRQLRQQTQIWGHLVEHVGTAKKEEMNKWLINPPKGKLHTTNLAVILIHSRDKNIQI